MFNGMRTHLLLKKPSRTIQLHTDRSFCQQQNTARTQHKRSNSSQSLCSSLSEVKNFMHADTLNSIKHVKVGTREIKDICRKQQFLTQTRMFNPREYFGAAFLNEAANLHLFDRHEAAELQQFRLRPGYFSVKVQNSKSRQSSKAPRELLHRSHLNSQKGSSSSLSKPLMLRSQKPSKHKQNFDPNAIVVSRTVQGTQHRVVLSIKGITKKNKKQPCSHH